MVHNCKRFWRKGKFENLERNVERSWHKNSGADDQFVRIFILYGTGRFTFKKPFGPLESKSIRYNVEPVAKCNMQFEENHKTYCNG